MKKELISVVVPIYNVEKYLNKCVDSIINQSYKNLEIILVDDGSTDNSSKICDEYLKKDNRIKVIHKKNGGLSDARNTGLDSAKGNYISFIDSDDYISSDYYEKMINKIIKDKSDLCITDIKTVYENDNYEFVNKAYNGEATSIGFINTGLAASACNKLFKRELFNKYKFEKGKINEDIAVIIPILANVKKISYVEKTYYYYVQRGNSIQNSSFSYKRFDIIHSVDLTLDRIKDNKNYSEIKDALVFNQIVVLLLYVIPKISNIFYRSRIIKEYYKLTKKYNIKNNKYYLEFLSNTGKKHRIYYKLLFDLCFNRLSFLCSLLIAIYDIAKVFLKKSVIKKVDDDVLVREAINNSNRSDYGLSISVVIPNYNYSRFLSQRIHSILSQKVKIKEIIVLDDCSTDNSIEKIDELKELLGKYVNFRTIYNKENSGSAFKQWKKGFESTTGDYVWIAEADDYCDDKLLINLIKPILNNKDIVISYSDTAFIDAQGSYIRKSIKSEIDIQKTGHWDGNFINNGLDEISNYCYLNNTIANVSSCIIKKADYKEFFERASQFRQAGDWIFYTDVISTGSIAYIDKPLNYYRVHGNNVSSTTSYIKHLEELNRIYSYYEKKYKLNEEQKKNIKDRIDFLKKAWKLK